MRSRLGAFFAVLGLWSGQICAVEGARAEEFHIPACQAGGDFAKLVSPVIASPTELLATSFSQNARANVQTRLRRAFDTWNARLPVERRRAYGAVDPVSSFDRPQNPRFAALIERANALLQTESVILDFAETTAKRAALERLQNAPSQFDPKLLLKANSRDHTLLQKMADEQGWGKIEKEFQVYQPELFRHNVLMRGRLWTDSGAIDEGHPGATHALQWLMLTPHLEAEFGPGAARELLGFLSTREGAHLWEPVFDRGRGYIGDLRGPQAWEAAALAGRNSWLGIE